MEIVFYIDRCHTDWDRQGIAGVQYTQRDLLIGEV